MKMGGKGCLQHHKDPCVLNVCVGCGRLFLKDDFRFTSIHRTTVPPEGLFSPEGKRAMKEGMEAGNGKIRFACESCIKSGKRKWTPGG